MPTLHPEAEAHGYPTKTKYRNCFKVTIAQVLDDDKAMLFLANTSRFNFINSIHMHYKLSLVF